MPAQDCQIFKLQSTGTRIRTQIKGFGDPYATIALCPYLNFSNQQ
jgi:hypothetical protein